MDKHNGRQSSTADRRSPAWTEGEARTVLDEWATSGLRIGEFARRRGLKEKRLYWWRQRLSERRGEGEAAVVPSFIPLTVRGESVGAVAATVEIGPLRVEVGQLDAASASWVATLVRELGVGR